MVFSVSITADLIFSRGGEGPLQPQVLPRQDFAAPEPSSASVVLRALPSMESSFSSLHPTTPMDGERNMQTSNGDLEEGSFPSNVPGESKPVESQEGRSGGVNRRPSDAQRLPTVPSSHSWPLRRGRSREDAAGDSPEEAAARRIQHLVMTRFERRNRLDRKNLVERMALEEGMWLTLRLCMLYGVIFALLLRSMFVEIDSASQRGLLRSYERNFKLAELSDIATVEELREFLTTLSHESRKMQIQSSEYFVDETEQKILGGLVDVKGKPLSLIAGGLSARVDSRAFSISAWVELAPSSAGGYVIRKPLKPTGAYSALSCWGFFVGRKETRFDFGAHDFGGERAEQASAAVASRGVQTLHMQTVVVRQREVLFYHNAELVGRENISRPVTGCGGEQLEVGAEGMRLGELVFYPRELSQNQITEVFIGGNTLESLAVGKAAFAPEVTAFNMLQADTQARVDALQQRLEDAAREAQVEHAVQRGLLSNLERQRSTGTAALAAHADRAGAGAGLLLPEVGLEAGCGGADAWPPCRLIRGVNASLQPDPASRASFYDLIPAHNFEGLTPGGRLTVPASPLRRHQYDLASFPASVGNSFSLSVWVRALVDGSSTYLISKHPSSESSARCWSFNVADTRVGMYAGAIVDGVETEHGLVQFPDGVGKEFSLVNGPLLRHVVLAVDAAKGEVRAYMDGQLVGATPYRHAALLDCSNAGAYVAFLHRGPGSHDFAGDIQQFRLFPGVALDGDQVAAMHTDARDPDSGRALRECSFSHEGLDSSFRDVMGHGCEWMDEVRASNPQVCVGREVKEQCPVACGIDRGCFNSAAAAAAAGGGASGAEARVWERVMRIRPPSDGSAHTVCLAQHLDAAHVLQRCRDKVAPAPPGVATGTDANGIRKSRVIEGLLNSSDCEALAAAIDADGMCSFNVAPGPESAELWTRELEAGLSSGGAGAGSWTVSMWVRAAGDAGLDARGRFRPVIQLFSSLAPSQPVLTLHFYEDIFYAILARHCGAVEDVGVAVEGGSLGAEEEWVHVSVVWEDRGASAKLGLMVNAQTKQEVHVGGWCKADSGEFIQALSFSHELLVSTVRVRPLAVPEKLLQQEFYALRPAMRLRDGPRVPDAERLLKPITYEEKPYTAAGFLIAPPLLRQERVGKTQACSSRLGTAAIRSRWDYITTGFQCSPPFECSDALMASPSQLMSCSKKEEAASLFGMPAARQEEGGGAPVFTEFLASITDSPVLVRKGQVYQTERFIDGQTRSISVSMALVSPDNSVASIVSIEAQVGARVSASYSIRQIQSVEGQLLQQYKTFAVATFVMAAFLFLSCLQRASKPLLPRADRVTALLDGAVALAIVLYVAMRWHSNTALGAELAGHVGAHAAEEGGAAGHGRGILGVPWASDSVSYDDKLGLFFEAMAGLSGSITYRQRLDFVGFLISVILLVRIIVVVSVHPRVSLLVATVTTGADDFLHFFLLLSILFICFALIALLRFAPTYDDFGSMPATIVSQFNMMLGALPSNFEDDILLAIFSLLFLVTVFFLMLNFLLAIIVESYMRVKAQIERQETEQNLLADAAAALLVRAKRFALRWPPPFTVIARLEEQSAKFSVGIENLSPHDRAWSRESRISFMRHYQRYEFLAKKPPPERITTFDTAVEDLEKRIALLVKAKAPSAMERTIHIERQAHPRSNSIRSHRDGVTAVACDRVALKGFAGSQSSMPGLIAAHSEAPPGIPGGSQSPMTGMPGVQRETSGSA